MLQVDVASLKRNIGETSCYELQAALPPLEIRGEKVSFWEPVKVSLVVCNTGEGLLARGQITGELQLACDRCLELFHYAFSLPFEETYRPVPGGGEVPSGSGEKDAESVTFSGDILDITPEVLNSIILSLPMKALCKEDCPGLCPRCGSNLKDGQCGCESENIDPRLNVLKDFFSRSKK
ncbi:MAG TPA: DUF177 domain-containing protein [Bacillota bacterium]|jgi:uncharacterized protein|nr:DUF177 domain-containing protein [Peptococcaceae bacterium MAG4]NLW37442.1 DUF177 domain-containing protein [Peptococcaceae bacterium]HPU36293.1 DUF177 domain-containing protein [Bacillota bacterium]HPZ43452.1 DUF177 domain-containing protein [Bacillota bacterium]HQD76446.1 DUF177 domain-containing protein [Bacillota bacterium]